MIRGAGAYILDFTVSHYVRSRIILYRILDMLESINPAMLVHKHMYLFNARHFKLQILDQKIEYRHRHFHDIPFKMELEYVLVSQGSLLDILHGVIRKCSVSVISVY